MVTQCYTCGSCDNECPINRKSGQLSPRRIIRAYVLGIISEAAKYPEIWYCVRCGRCGDVCPMNVKPFDVISALQDVASSDKSESTQRVVITLRELRNRVQIARYLALQNVLDGKSEDLQAVNSSEIWEQAGTGAIQRETGSMLMYSPRERLKLELGFTRYFEFPTNIRRCISCGACTNACPASTGSSIFSPMKVFRMLKWGMVEEALREPGIWLCIDCGRCSNVCPQSIRGAWIMRILRDQACKSGLTNVESLNRWKIIDSELYRIYHEHIKNVLNTL